MPLKGRVRYRVKKTKKGKKVRLAFRGNEVVEAKNLATGKTHTEAEFKADKRKRKKKKKEKSEVEVLQQIISKNVDKYDILLIPAAMIDSESPGMFKKEQIIEGEANKRKFVSYIKLLQLGYKIKAVTIRQNDYVFLFEKCLIKRDFVGGAKIG